MEVNANFLGMKDQSMSRIMRFLENHDNISNQITLSGARLASLSTYLCKCYNTKMEHATICVLFLKIRCTCLTFLKIFYRSQGHSILA